MWGAIVATIGMHGRAEPGSTDISTLVELWFECTMVGRISCGDLHGSNPCGDIELAALPEIVSFLRLTEHIERPQLLQLAAKQDPKWNPSLVEDERWELRRQGQRRGIAKLVVDKQNWAFWEWRGEWIGPEPEPVQRSLAELLRQLRSAAGTVALDSVLQDFASAPPGAVPALEAMLEEREAALRVAAASALERMGEKALPALPKLGRLLTDRSKLVKTAALQALWRIGPPSALAGLAKVVARKLRDRDNVIRESALRLLRHMGPAGIGGLSELGKGLEHKSEDIQVSAAEAIGYLGAAATSARPSLEALAAKGGRCGYAARQALQKFSSPSIDRLLAPLTSKEANTAEVTLSLEGLEELEASGELEQEHRRQLTAALLALLEADPEAYYGQPMELLSQVADERAVPLFRRALGEATDPDGAASYAARGWYRLEPERCLEGIIERLREREAGAAEPLCCALSDLVDQSELYYFKTRSGIRPPRSDQDRATIRDRCLDWWKGHRRQPDQA